MALIAGGDFIVGAESSEFDGPAHSVKLETFVIDKAETTVGAVRAFKVSNPSVVWPLPPPIADLRPVTNVTVEQAEAFCAWHVEGGRLPTELEWEAAARGTVARTWPWGEAPKPECIHANQGSDGLSIAANELPCGATPEGVLQLLGNVAELTSSQPSLYPNSSAPRLPVFDKPGYFIIRGGSFNEDAMEVSTTARSIRRSGDAEQNFDVGFRCVAPHQLVGR